MRSLLLLVLLFASAPGCCCTSDGSCPPGGRPTMTGRDYAAYRPYSPGYRRPCFPAYRPIDSAFLP